MIFRRQVGLRDDVGLDVAAPESEEDRKLVEDVQRGVASGAVERGVLMGRSEQLIGHFEALTSAALA